MKYDFSGAVKRTVEPVGNEAFRLFARVLVGDRPGMGIINYGIWQNDKAAKAISETEARQAAFLAHTIMKYSEAAIVQLSLDDEFRAALTADFHKGWGRKQAKKRALERTGPFKSALEAQPDASTKEVIRTMEANGTIKDLGNGTFEIVSSKKKISGNSLPSKISRERKKLRNT